MATVTVSNRVFDVSITPHPTLPGAYLTEVTAEDKQPFDDLRTDIVKAAFQQQIGNAIGATTTKEN